MLQVKNNSSQLRGYHCVWESLLLSKRISLCLGKPLIIQEDITVLGKASYYPRGYHCAWESLLLSKRISLCLGKPLIIQEDITVLGKASYYPLHPILHTFLQCSLWNSSGVYVIDDGCVSQNRVFVVLHLCHWFALLCPMMVIIIIIITSFVCCLCSSASRCATLEACATSLLQLLQWGPTVLHRSLMQTVTRVESQKPGQWVKVSLMSTLQILTLL